MAGKPNGLVILIVVLLICSLGLGWYGFDLLQKEKAKVESLNEEIIVLTQKNKQAQIEIDDKKSKITALESQLQETNAELLTLRSSLEKEKSDKSQALSKVKELTDQISAKENEKATLEKKLTDSENTLREVDKRVKEMEEQLKSAEALKKDLEKKVLDLESKSQNVELGKIVVNPDAPKGAEGSKSSGKPVKALEGKILVVNKDYKFAVINLGSKDGVSVGSIFSVTHNNKNVGDVKVEKVHENMSAAGFVTLELKDKLAEGDSVALKK